MAGKNDSKVKICFVAPLPPPYGGIANWTKLFAEYLKQNDLADVSVVNTAPKGRVTEGRGILKRVILESPNIKLYSLSLSISFTYFNIGYGLLVTSLSPSQDTALLSSKLCNRFSLTPQKSFGSNAINTKKYETRNNNIPVNFRYSLRIFNLLTHCLIVFMFKLYSLITSSKVYALFIIYGIALLNLEDISPSNKLTTIPIPITT